MAGGSGWAPVAIWRYLGHAHTLACIRGAGKEEAGYLLDALAAQRRHHHPPHIRRWIFHIRPGARHPKTERAAVWITTGETTGAVSNGLSSCPTDDRSHPHLAGTKMRWQSVVTAIIGSQQCIENVVPPSECRRLSQQQQQHHQPSPERVHGRLGCIHRPQRMRAH